MGLSKTLKLVRILRNYKTVFGRGWKGVQSKELKKIQYIPKQFISMHVIEAMKP